ncbi:hypothetical protein ABKW28_02200 [Nocardioides sp. 31GB23]|uniref:hypothetical protein n=1 Tax=Nocardioides sp. 31GB23 TaxID=3156065 RepID=UPI0032AFBE0A
MWDTVDDQPDHSSQPGDPGRHHGAHLSHDRPCPRCGHAMHVFLACDSGCDCQPAALPQHLAHA